MSRYGCSSKEVEKTTSNVLLRGRHPNEYVAKFKSKQIPQHIMQVDC